MSVNGGAFFDVTLSYNYRGIAGHVLGWELYTNSYYDEVLEDWCEGDCYSDTFVRFVWYGDDTVHVLDKDDLTAVSDDGFCAGCGQVGCF